MKITSDYVQLLVDKNVEKKNTNYELRATSSNSFQLWVPIRELRVRIHTSYEFQSTS